MRVGRSLFSSCLPQRITRENRLLLVGKEGLLHDLKDPPSNYQVRLNLSREKKTVTKSFLALEILLDMYRLLLGQIISGRSKNNVKNLEMDRNFFPFVP